MGGAAAASAASSAGAGAGIGESSTAKPGWLQIAGHPKEIVAVSFDVEPARIHSPEKRIRRVGGQALLAWVACLAIRGGKHISRCSHFSDMPLAMKRALIVQHRCAGLSP
jgi:hypothetical protein